MHGMSGAAVLQQAQQFRACIMPYGIHHTFALGNQGKVEIGYDHPFAFRERGSEQLAFGRDYGSKATAPQRAFKPRVTGYVLDLLFRKLSCGVYDKAAGFQRMVANGHFHLVCNNWPHQ